MLVFLSILQHPMASTDISLAEALPAPYAMLCSGNGPCTDATEQFQGIVNFACGHGSGDESELEMLISDAGRRPSDRFILRYPGSYNLTRARFVENRRLRSTNSWALFVGDGTVYESV